MKTSKPVICSLLGLLLLMTFAITAIQSCGWTETLTVHGLFSPSRVNLRKPAPKRFWVLLWFPRRSGASVRDIDPDTIRVEGILEPIEGTTRVFCFLLRFSVDGQGLVDLIEIKISHMGIPPGKQAKVPITVTGQLYDGNTFEKTFRIRVYYSPEPPRHHHS